MRYQSLEAITERATTDARFFSALVSDGASIVSQSAELLVALKGGASKQDLEHGAYSACTSTSCGCGGSI